MPPRKPQVASHSALGQETSPEESQGTGDKAAHKRKLEDGARDVLTASKRALESVSAPPVGHKTAPVTHLVPPESIPPHPPHSFNAMLPQDQHYDAYMCPDVMEAKLSEVNNHSSGPADIPIDPALQAPHELDMLSLIQGYDSDTKRMPPPATSQSIPFTLVSAAIIKSLFDTLSTCPTSTNPFNML
ncbi:hypothetical protein BD769DRAFT_1658212 [Suillus cothurnatus]|nr:hypothetical protein BD769DRAFT_1658212 [Suillus cothurnatus]